MYYSESHEWLRIDIGKGVVGITHYAQGELGEIVFIELPKVGQILKAREEVCVLESTKAAADVYSPVSGKVIEINEELKKNPSLINEGAENAGWLFKLELANPNEIKQLMDEKQYKALIGAE